MSNTGRQQSRWRGVIGLITGVGLVAFALPQSQLFASSTAPLPGKQPNGSTTLVSGRTITPAGTQTSLWITPMNEALSPNGKRLLVANAGASDPEMLQVIDTSTHKVIQSLPFRSPASVSFGLVYTPNGTRAFASDGSLDTIHAFVVSGSGGVPTGKADLIPGLLQQSGNIDLGPGNGSVYPYGIAVTPDASLLLAADNMSNDVSVISLASNHVVARVPIGNKPYTIVVAPDGKHAYATNWQDATVSVINVGSITTSVAKAAGSPVSVHATATIKVGNHPTAMAFSPGGGTLYVTDTNSDAVSVIDTASNAVVRTISLSPYANAPMSSSPMSLALSADGSTLYAADAGEDAVAAINVATGATTGRIPTGWYPSSVILSKDGASLFVTNAKGYGGGPNDKPVATSPNPTRKVPNDDYCDCAQDQYTGSYIVGTLSTIPVPGAGQLSAYTKQVAHNNRVNDAGVLARSTGNPIPLAGGTSPFTHVIYVIKENRSYDQVLGDIQGANGDPSLALFGKNVTPNEHALAMRFGLPDNFYADAEVTAAGHEWIDGAYAGDYVEKMWPIYYSYGFVQPSGTARNRAYDFNGGSLISTNSSGYIWDAAHAAGITYRDYGEYYTALDPAYEVRTVKPISPSQTDSCPGPVTNHYLAAPLGLPVRIPNAAQEGFYPANVTLCFPPESVNPTIAPNLVGHIDPKYREFDVQYSDADHFAEWNREFTQFVKNGNLPALEIMRLPNDHTAGTIPGFLSPQAYNAQNDQAIGDLVDAVSHSPYWKNTLILITEDDAQNGPDHVDGHRTVALAISAYSSHTKLTVDHTLYDTSSMVRTIELVLGLKPMSQFDAEATPMWRMFTSTPDLTPFNAQAETISPTTFNTVKTPGAQASSTMNFRQEDRAPADALNRIIWASVKGAKSSYPVTHYSVLGGDKD
jgi:YVTN family beta-propeller protein